MWTSFRNGYFPTKRIAASYPPLHTHTHTHKAAAAKQIAEQNLVRLEAEVSGSGDASARLAAELQAVQEQCAQLSADLQNKDAEMSRLQAAVGYGGLRW